MALLLAMLRTLVDEGLDAGALHRAAERAGGQAQPRVALHHVVLRRSTIRATGSLEFVNAGHLPPMLRRADGRFERVDAPGAGGVALGMFEQSTYSTHVAHIERGDVLVLYSDGITEAENRSGRPFEESGLEAIINSEAARDPEAIGRAVLAAVEAYAGDARLADDLTALVLKRSASRSAHAPTGGRTPRPLPGARGHAGGSIRPTASGAVRRRRPVLADLESRAHEQSP